MKKNILLKLSAAVFAVFCLVTPFFGLSLPKPDGWVSDLAGVMDEGTKSKIAAVISRAGTENILRDSSSDGKRPWRRHHRKCRCHPF